MSTKLDDLLDEFDVLECEGGPLNGLFVVGNGDGDIAYFKNEADAYAFRLVLINNALNGHGMTKPS